MGMEYYSLDLPGVGGRLKKYREDFVVSEITSNGKRLALRPWSEPICTTIDGAQDRFITIVVQKAGLTTLDTVMILATALKLPHHLVTYAGLKDKRAITVQHMSIPSSAGEQLKDLHTSRIRISEPRYTHHPVQIGDLWGNHFTIRLREIEQTCSDVIDSAKIFSQRPLLNYFGIQRFGVVRPPSHLSGCAIVRKDYEEAIRIMLTTTSQYESESLTETRLRLKDDFVLNESLLDNFPEDLRNEHIVIRHLIKHPGDYETAITKMNSRVQTLLVHSYQSYLFNCLISQRAGSGFSINAPTPGDFLIQLDEPHSGRDSWRYVTERNLDESAELVESEKFGLACPVPGYSTKTPPSKQSDILQDLLEKEGIDLFDFRNSSYRQLDSPGGYHLAALMLKNFTIECLEDDILMNFSLRKGSYATVVVRELMRNHPINRM
jgi:tRNA pseudouridine13 synthase